MTTSDERVLKWIWYGEGASDSSQFKEIDFKKRSDASKHLSKLKDSAPDKRLTTWISHYGGDSNTIDYVESEVITPNNESFRTDTIDKIKSAKSVDVLKSIKESVIDPNEDTYEQDTINAIKDEYNKFSGDVEVDEVDRVRDRSFSDLVSYRPETVKGRERWESQVFNETLSRGRELRDRGDINGLEDLKDTIRGTPDESYLRGEIDNFISRAKK